MDDSDAFAWTPKSWIARPPPDCASTNSLWAQGALVTELEACLSGIYLPSCIMPLKGNLSASPNPGCIWSMQYRMNMVCHFQELYSFSKPNGRSDFPSSFSSQSPSSHMICSVGATRSMAQKVSTETRHAWRRRRLRCKRAMRRPFAVLSRKDNWDQCGKLVSKMQT